MEFVKAAKKSEIKNNDRAFKVKRQRKAVN